MADEINIVVKADDQFSSTLGNFGNIMTGIKSTLDIVGQAFKGVYDFGSQFVQSAMDSQNVIADLEATLTSTGGAAGLTSQQLQDMASQLQSVTKFSDETIIKGEAMLLTFTNIGADVFPMATEAMLNLGEKFGSVDSAAVQLGKALNDPLTGITALTRVGVTFSEEQKNTIKAMMDVGDVAGAQGVILAELNKEFGGLAEAAGQTFAGQLEIAKNQVDSIKESIGNALLPVLSSLLGKFQDALPAIQSFVDVFINALNSGDFSELFATFEDGSSYLGGLIEAFGIAEEQAYSFAASINSLITSGDFLGNLTKSIGDFLVNIDWKGLSQQFADGMNNIDWVKVGQVIRTGLGMALAGLDFLLNTVLKTAVENIDWGAVAKSMGNAITGIIAGAFGYVNWDALMVDFKNGFVYIGQQALTGLASIFGYSAWANFAQDVKEGFQVIVNGIKDFLGISSPSTLFMDIGKNMMQGLLDGIKGMASTLLAAIKTIVAILIEPFKPILEVLGIDVSGLTSSGGIAGGTTGGYTGSGTAGSAGQVVNNYYGPVYFGATGEPNSYYDCPSPNPLVAASGNQLVATGF